MIYKLIFPNVFYIMNSNPPVAGLGFNIPLNLCSGICFVHKPGGSSIEICNIGQTWLYRNSPYGQPSEKMAVFRCESNSSSSALKILISEFSGTGAMVRLFQLYRNLG